MNNTIIKRALLHISENPFSFNHHLFFWKEEMDKFDNNPEEFILTINSKLFDWCSKSNFSSEFEINPISQAIAESDKFSDFLVYAYNNLGDLLFSKQMTYGFYKIYRHYLYKLNTEELKKIHPYFNFIHADRYMMVDEIRDNLKEKAIKPESINLVQNLTNLFLKEIFFDGGNISISKMNDKIFWKIIALGVKLPIDRLEECFLESKKSILFDRNVLITNFQEYYIEGKIPAKLKRRFPTKDQRDNIVKFLEDIKNRPSFALLLGLK
jgi:hypothetical protein